MTNIKIADLETNLFEDLSDADLIAVVGGAVFNGIKISESDIGGDTTVTADEGGFTTKMVGSSVFTGFYNAHQFQTPLGGI